MLKNGCYKYLWMFLYHSEHALIFSNITPHSHPAITYLNHISLNQIASNHLLRTTKENIHKTNHVQWIFTRSRGITCTTVAPYMHHAVTKLPTIQHLFNSLNRILSQHASDEHDVSISRRHQVIVFRYEPKPLHERRCGLDIMLHDTYYF